jgi:hypothetical protein
METAATRRRYYRRWPILSPLSAPFDVRRLGLGAARFPSNGGIKSDLVTVFVPLRPRKHARGELNLERPPLRFVSLFRASPELARGTSAALHFEVAIATRRLSVPQAVSKAMRRGTGSGFRTIASETAWNLAYRGTDVPNCTRSICQQCNLMRLGAPRHRAIRHARSRRGYWQMAKTIAGGVGLDYGWLLGQGPPSMTTL